MKLKLYQVNMDRDTAGVAFENLNLMKHLTGSSEINSAIYDLVFDGQIPCSDLEAAYQMFNMEHPDGYRGRSMSVSDVVEVTESEKVEPGFNFCDSFGFKKIDFDPTKAQTPLKENTIRVVLLEPGKIARVAEIDGSLEGMQRTVKGDIEPFYPFEEEVCIVCNDEGKINGMALNRAIREETQEVDMSYRKLTSVFREKEKQGEHITGYIVISADSFDQPYPLEARTYAVSSDNKAFQPGMGGYSIYGSSIDGSDPMVRLEGYLSTERGGANGWKIERCYLKQPGSEIIDIIAGPCFICDCSGENFGSLSDKQVEKYLDLFKYPESFTRINGEIVAMPYKPRARSADMER